MKRLAFIVGVWLIASCTTKVAPLVNDADFDLGESGGYILLGVGANRELMYIQLSGPQNIKLTSKDLRSGTQYLLVNLKAGVYVIEKVQLNEFTHIRLGEKVWEIEVKPETISYVGNLEITSRGFWSVVETVNRSSEALEFMEKDFPNILSSRDLIFSGAGVDYFFDMVVENKADKKQ